MTRTRTAVALAAVVALALGTGIALQRSETQLMSSESDRGVATSADGAVATEQRLGIAGSTASTGSASSASAGAGGGGGTSAAPVDVATNALPVSVSQPQVVRTGTVRVEVDDGAFSKAFSRVATIASSLGGFVASSTSAAGDGANGTVVVRVPAERFDEARRQLHALGTLESEQLNGEDVSGQLTDLDARLRNLRAQEEAIRALMAKAKDVPETLTVQNQLSAVREQIEQLAAQQARLADAAAVSTITVELFEPGAAAKIPNDDRSPIANALADAVDAAESVLAGTIVALGYLVPLGLLVAAAALLARPLVAARRRSGRPAEA